MNDHSCDNLSRLREEKKARFNLVILVIEIRQIIHSKIILFLFITFWTYFLRNASPGHCNKSN